MIANLSRGLFKFSSMFPKIVNEGVAGRMLKVVHSSENGVVPENEKDDFVKNNKV